MNNLHKITIVFLLSFSIGISQEKLTKEAAINLALENNYGIKMAKNKVKIAENNASIFNSGYIPNVSASTGASFTNNSSELTSQSGSVTEIDNAESKSYNGSIGINYTLFDGFGRSYNYKKMKEASNLSELEAQTVIENAVLQLVIVYFNVAQLTEDVSNIAETLNISKQRLERAKYGFDYGQNTKLQVLNAEVDANNDSIRYINTQRFLANAKRDLNLIVGRDVTENFSVDTSISFNQLFDFQELITKSKQYNIEMQKVSKSIELSNYDLKINKSNLFPTVDIRSSYGFNKSDNDATFNYAEQFSKGLNGGVSLNWNIFDGGITKTRIQNSKIIADNLQIEKEKVENELEGIIANSLEVYNNALFILKAEEKNVETNKLNFLRTEDQFKLGQITSIEFRQAQLNLFNAQSNLNQAKYDAKNAEIKLLQLSGDLLNVQF